ncbi:hypothetical protein BCT47_02415 [Vibrio splendidus]|nr:hypothetical protein BCT47_02415 [Vibrio splendidus]
MVETLPPNLVSGIIRPLQLAPHLEMTKVGKLTLYLSPDIPEPERKFSIDELLAEVKLSKKQTKLWAAYFRDLASELDALMTRVISSKLKSFWCSR